MQLILNSFFAAFDLKYVIRHFKKLYTSDHCITAHMYKHRTVVGDNINTMKTTFDFNQAFKHMDF